MWGLVRIGGLGERAGSFAVVVAVTVFSGSTSAMAQAAPALVPSGCTSTFAPTFASNALAGIVGGIAGATNSVTSVVGTTNTSFVAQGNAFVAGLPSPKPDETSGGVWGRLVGGRVETSATTTFNGSGGLGATTGQVNCNSGVRQDYAGFQVGQDIARLNIGSGGGSLHFGITGGFAEVDAQNRSGAAFTGHFQVPFAGLYASYTNGPFFADILARGDLYQISLSSAEAALSNQRLDAVGGTLSSSAGYRIDLGQNWVVEPSISGIYSKVNVDTLHTTVGWGNSASPFWLPLGTVNFNPIESILGRAGVRVATTVNTANVTWQPFATASVWHEFAGNTMATYTGSLFPNGTAGDASGALSSSRIGTYGQYSVGVAAQVASSPLLGYLRIDYRNGSNIESLGFNGGLRYNFDPGTGLLKPAGIFKAPVQPAVVYDWTGFYAGAFTGAGWGSNDWNFPGAGVGAHPRIAGALLGANLGYNKQIGPWVLGAEGDAAATSARGGQGCQPGTNAGGGVNAPAGSIIQNCNNDLNWVATATAKVGYAWDRVLIYAKGGGAFLQNDLDLSCNGDALGAAPFAPCRPANNPAGTVQHLSATLNQLGWTVGAGFELALSPTWSAKAEYDYMKFGSRNVVLPDTTVVNLKQDFNQVKVGVNYHFGKDAVVVAPAMPVKAAPQAIFNWTGPYLGAAVSDRMSVSAWDTSARSNQLNPAILFPPDVTTTPSPFFSSNPQARLYGGYNWQFTPKWLAGVEADVGAGDSKMSKGGIPGTFGNGSNAPNHGIGSQTVDSSDVKLSWDGTIRAKLGMLITPTTAFYGTGGAAFQQVAVSSSCQTPLTFQDHWCHFGSKSQSFSSIRAGWTAGLGIESVLTGNWLGKVEARYADFGHYKNTFFAGTGDDVVTSVRVQTFTALAGVSYKFSGPTAVIAAY